MKDFKQIIKSNRQEIFIYFQCKPSMCIYLW